MKIKILLLAVFAISACKQAPPASEEPKLSAFESLIGKWENRSPEGVFVEQWFRESDSIFRGTGAFIVGADTSFSEQLAIISKGDSVYYETIVSGQNEGKPVRFKLTEQKDNVFQFENRSHDFPQKIRYTMKEKDQLTAEVSGMVEGVERKEVFDLKRAGTR